MEWLLVLRWVLVLGTLAAIGAPLSAWLFPRLPRRGAAFALPTTLLAVALVVFWVGQVTFGLHTVVFGVLLTGAASALAYRDGAKPDWKAVSRAFGVFTVGFLILVFFRGASPGITPAGGEQFLHFGLTKALSRAPALPPEDFWFAGEPLRYYYGTQLQVTGLSMLTGTPLRLGFNLGIATFYGVLVVSAYGLAGAVTHAAGYSYRLGGVLGAFFVAVGGAFTTTVRLLFGLLPEDVAVQHGQAAFGAIRHMPYEEAVVTQSNPAEWGWFFTRYVVPGTLQEFPMYSFIKGDLHGHAFANGYVVLAAALAYSYYRLPAERRGRRLAVLFGGLGTVAGVFGFMNTWSLPTAIGLAWLAVAAADAHPVTLVPSRLLPAGLTDRLAYPDAGADADADASAVTRLAGELWRVVIAVVPAVLVGAIGVALASPFLVFGHVPQNEGVGFFPPRTALAPFLVIYGALLALFAGYLAYRIRPATRQIDRRVKAAVAGVGLVAVAALLTVLSFPVLAVTGPLLLGAWWLVRTDRAGFGAVLLVAGVGLVLSLELVFAKVAPWPEGPARWNTSLKVAVQGWTLAGVAAGTIGTILLGEARGALAVLRSRTTTGSPASADGGSARSVAPAVLAGVLVVAVVVASSPFAVLAAGTEVGDELADGNELTLDGLATHEKWKEAQMEAIEWLDDRQGTPTIVEAPGHDAYRWTSPVSTMTGLPTVIGWTGHQENYRPSSAVSTRIAEGLAIYQGRWQNAVDALRKHDVEYVYVGPTEREKYGRLLHDF
ncbi:MAG: YYY domain-containing protein, partial [Haloarculaceae archaeon]